MVLTNIKTVTQCLEELHIEMAKGCRHNFEIIGEGEGYWKVKCVECGKEEHRNAYTGGSLPYV